MTSNNQTKEQEIREKFHRKYEFTIFYATGEKSHNPIVDKEIADWWLKELNSALQEQKEKIINDLKNWTNKNYRRSTEPLYAWVDASDLVEELNKLTIVNQNAKLESDKVNEE